MAEYLELDKGFEDYRNLRRLKPFSDIYSTKEMSHNNAQFQMKAHHLAQYLKKEIFVRDSSLIKGHFSENTYVRGKIVAVDSENYSIEIDGEIKKADLQGLESLMTINDQPPWVIFIKGD